TVMLRVLIEVAQDQQKAVERATVTSFGQSASKSGHHVDQGLTVIAFLEAQSAKIEGRPVRIQLLNAVDACEKAAITCCALHFDGATVDVEVLSRTHGPLPAAERILAERRVEQS